MEDLIEFEASVARYYVKKVRTAKKAGIAFNLSLLSVRNLATTRLCPLSGVELKVGDNFSIDRIDNSLPYQSGNVMACSIFANSVKGGFESNTGQSLSASILKLKESKTRELEQMQIKLAEIDSKITIAENLEKLRRKHSLRNIKP